MTNKVTPHLMFEGTAEEALKFYVSLFQDSEIVEIERYGPGEQGPEGSFKRAAFTLAGQDFICLDSPVKHEFTFTPSISLFVDCENDAEIEGIYSQLSNEGTILMPLDKYDFSRKFGWVNDRFGVSWQLNLA